MLTPTRIQALADPIESVYQHMVDELLVNIGKHITSPTWTHTASWEIQKLAELGQLTRENAAIINAWIKRIPDEVRSSMEATRAEALDRIEKQLEEAAKNGYVTPAETDTTVAVLRDLSQQALDKFNLTNTTMLQSSVDQYVRGVQLTEQEMRVLEAKKQASVEALNEAVANIASGAETRRMAINRALKRISDEGLTGFIDRAGRSWSPEAYVNMVTRTTVHNVAIESTRARMQDYNTQVFQVSSHAGARPLCYPYQGKFLSWDNTAGEIPLGDGSVVRYEPLNSTSYGQAAGLFGINCGHFPIPIIPGVTIPHGADNIQPKEENDKEYAESQEQRALERQIREAKRVVAMDGDLATKEDKVKVRELQAQMREFTDRTGRARRYDRESIVKSGESGSLQSRAVQSIITKKAVSAKVTARGEVVNPMPEQEYKTIVSRLNANGIEVFAATGGDDLRYMLSIGAEGSYADKQIRHIGMIPSRGTLYEEIIHAAQARKYGELEETNFEELYAREIEANRKLLQYKDVYNLDEIDVADIQRNLQAWEALFMKARGEAYNESAYRGLV